MVVDPRNVQFKVILDTDPFQLEFNPKLAFPRIFKAENVVELYNKLETTQLLGYIMQFDLTWEKNVPFDENQYEILKGLFKETPAFYFYPNPSAEPTLRFLVRWKNNFEFEPGTGWIDGWSWFGTITLIGAELLQAGDIGDWSFYEY